MPLPTRRDVLRVTGSGVVAGVAGCIGGGESSDDDVDRVRERLSRYADVTTANADGYELSTPYVRSEEGILGMPFVNHGAPDLDPDEPNALFYHLRADGTFELMGAKWFVYAPDVDATPSMFGEEFFGPSPGEIQEIPEHYGLHAWLFEDNPDGLYARYHGGVEPPAYIDELDAVWEGLSKYYSNEELAMEDGYENTEACIETRDGGYGIPAINRANTGTDPAKPAVLLYRFASNWNYRLLGAEWYVPVDSTDSPPSMFGREFSGPMEAHNAEIDQPEHYGIHAWAFTANPNGMFAFDNPLIEC